jgi:hypothetical protein
MTHIEKENVSVPIIVQAIGGDLRLRGRTDDRLQVDGTEPHVEQIGDGQPFVVRCDCDCRIWVPQTVDVSVQQVSGDAKVTDLNGALDIKTIGGDLTLRNIQGAQIKTVGGDLRIKWAEGDLTIETVGADGTIREVDGAVWVANVGSDLYLRNIKGSCKVENVGSDLVLNFEFQPDCDYRFCAGSDVLCRVRPGTNARFVLPLDVNVALDVPAEITEDEETGQQIVMVGEGGPTVYIEAGDDLRLVGEEEDYVLNLSVQIEEELDARLSSLEEKLSEHLEGLDERIQSKAEQYSSQAEKLAERAQHQAQQAIERVRMTMERKAKRGKSKRKPRQIDFTWDWDSNRPPKPKQATEPVSEEERLMILRMVQENTISIEEAERLLSALESQD